MEIKSVSSWTLIKISSSLNRSIPKLVNAFKKDDTKFPEEIVCKKVLFWYFIYEYTFIQGWDTSLLETLELLALIELFESFFYNFLISSLKKGGFRILSLCR